MSDLFVNVFVEQAQYSFDRQYAYSVPEQYRASAEAGRRVLVPFGNANKPRMAVIFSVTEEKPESKRIKSIFRVMDETPILSDEMLKLALWMKDRTFCTVYDAVKSMLPGGINYKMVVRYMPASDSCDYEGLSGDENRILSYLRSQKKYMSREAVLDKLGFSADSTILEDMSKKGVLFRNYDTVRRIGDASLKMIRLCCNEEELENKMSSFTKKQQAVVQLLKDVGSASLKEVCYFTGVTVAVPNALIAKGIAEIYEREVLRSPLDFDDDPVEEQIVLSEEQQKAYLSLQALYEQDKSKGALLHGVTGSGKTQVYLKLIDRAMNDGKSVIVMVPEISLTPQTIRIFKRRYGNKIAVFHSALSMGERVDEFKRVKNKEAVIAIGTRSAVFAPVQNLGLIIMDEEQEHTYKSESTPRYHARDIARFRCAYHNALLLLASATPCVETYAMAKRGRYSLFKLTNRYGNAKLPKVVCVDMNRESGMGERTFLSTALIEALKENLLKHEQSIILLNRRGYNTFVACRKCGHVVTCPGCSISMTYHSANNKLMCHYCGYTANMAEKCTECGSENIRYSGVGTQKIEMDLKSLFPSCRILRMDSDSVLSRMAYEESFERFGKGEYDIMLGTQMVAKGLNFENVTLTGVLSADSQLSNDDFRSTERTFSLLTQVVGRSGRGKLEGKAIIQSFEPENETIRFAQKQNYEAFYEKEIRIRKMMVYPPFCDLCVIGFVGKDEERVCQASEAFLQALIAASDEKYKGMKLIVLGPVPLKVAKVSNKFRYRLILKCHNSAQLRQMISELLMWFEKERAYADITVYADMNPESML